jgi:hypothetical protein
VAVSVGVAGGVPQQQRQPDSSHVPRLLLDAWSGHQPSHRPVLGAGWKQSRRCGHRCRRPHLRCLRRTGHRARPTSAVPVRPQRQRGRDRGRLLLSWFADVHCLGNARVAARRHANLNCLARPGKRAPRPCERRRTRKSSFAQPRSSSPGHCRFCARCLARRSSRKHRPLAADPTSANSPGRRCRNRGRAAQSRQRPCASAGIRSKQARDRHPRWLPQAGADRPPSFVQRSARARQRTRSSIKASLSVAFGRMR